ncbi:MAG: IS110 family transposase [Streptomyces sp.]|nr:IS110 family transposase [Streptomyces sp.]
MTIPGISLTAAQLVVAEIGVDMRRFPTAGHLASRSEACPGNHESAGKVTSGRTRHGECLAQGSPGQRCRRSGPLEEHLPRCPVPAPGRPPGQETRPRRRRALDPRRRLAHPHR